ncbi:MAG: hypothetical protein HYX68_26915 [Planctomycetes bacterium]|nr:hypothetical protein [Planctomycetota bacterium]
MRKQIWIGTLAMALGCAAGYWHFMRQPHEPLRGQRVAERSKAQRVMPPVIDEGDAEASDVVEPLVVDRGPQTPTFTEEPPWTDEPMARVALTRDMTQPPRPDAEPGAKVRMPYADEQGDGEPNAHPELRLGSVLPDQFFELTDKGNPAEESENQRAIPGLEPLRQILDYHYQHCPHHGGCPAPFPSRSMPRR